MKPKEVMEVLKISLPTIINYIEQGKLIAHKLPNGHRIFDAESVYRLLNHGIKRKTVIYGRVST